MGTFVGILLVAALAAGVVWNRKNAQAALEGVEVVVPCAVDEVVAALDGLYCKGVKAATRGMLGGVRMTRSGPTGFNYRSRYGDVGDITVTAQGAGTRLQVAATDLYVGAPDKGIPDRGIFALSWNIVNGVYRLLGITPGSGRMKRFQAKVPVRLERHLVKQGLVLDVPQQRSVLNGPALGPDGAPVRTSAGYEAPPEAVVVGTRCSSCGVREDAPPSVWPSPCSGCGEAADPVFAEPWQHDAEGVELRHKVSQDPEDSFSAGRLHVWQHADALRSGRTAEVTEARRAARDHETRMRSADPHFQPGDVWFHYVWSGMEAQDFDGAAEDLVHWLSTADSAGVEEHNGRRTNCRQAVSSALRFLDDPRGAGHPRADEVRRGCLAVATGAYSVLNADAQRAVTALARTA